MSTLLQDYQLQLLHREFFHLAQQHMVTHNKFKRVLVISLVSVFMGISWTIWTWVLFYGQVTLLISTSNFVAQLKVVLTMAHSFSCRHHRQRTMRHQTKQLKCSTSSSLPVIDKNNVCSSVMQMLRHVSYICLAYLLDVNFLHLIHVRPLPKH